MKVDQSYPMLPNVAQGSAKIYKTALRNIRKLWRFCETFIIFPRDMGPIYEKNEIFLKSSFCIIVIARPPPPPRPPL